ncbi:bifunctional 23S rRNA (guanine(2069)-N(7))-methyltransferase RlmK/23S rRNA (guanine(2445)-N(2))-methyltransferase RlmL [Alteromonas sp. a30]|uniref:bifunctional 23S rRNA (guanine(2069)-N(7))-methyltransferase RlmK/23S rRNA (guanine(2445)-N(2))-methyltransferase RlmL n=1 Tax=Alteromonas sp. a30 TaxID=2730917 RepID=UPI00228140EF|nr:bifunctional 23S rRNA (guanine(2069)-N(7))-methyltransferase RlmK/23S rRNA (guanine(2445)-N(2))-methyltransferase RlmL [Alteromonas sp. a30]MCY7293900.1 bifunctional 23S rRNA (guanine(2069)-N(7))-methyltransferase RlmK/23S rRNA (guanine(2445)-N(2))-methyltransferase RlmL [Alteromonas sp. a30]
MYRFLITTSKGLEQLLQQEIQHLLPEIETRNRPGQVVFEAELADAYRLCLWSRLANRVLLQLRSGKGETGDELYDLANKVNWSSHFSADQSFSIDFVGTSRAINNTQFGAMKIKDAIVDHFKDLFDTRPNVEKQFPDLKFHGRLNKEGFGIYLDLSGGSLHQRRYRERAGRAPIKENLAFAVLMRSGWVDAIRNGDESSAEIPVFDPMCGSGTILIEAAQYAAKIAPGLHRHQWGFSHWKGHDIPLWFSLLDEAKVGQITPSMRFLGTDIDAHVIEIAKDNANIADVGDFIQFEVADATQQPNTFEKAGYIVSNVPYGERLGELTELLPMFKSWGGHLKQAFPEWHLSLLTSDRDMLRQLRLMAGKEYQFINGNIECQLVNFHLDEKNCHIADKEQDNHSDFANRLRKNISKLKKWLKTANTDCYRVYDADLPEYNVAIDVYGDWVVVQEYAAPKNIPKHKTISRLQDILIAIPDIMQIEPSQLVLKTRQVQKGKAQYQKLDKSSDELIVHENGAKFAVNLHDYLDTGLFLDHRDVRQKVRQMSKDKRVLNLFAYTGSVSVFAALGGAKSVTTVDMSNTYLNWAKRNLALNGIKGAYQYPLVRKDCLTWIRECEQQFDLIFVDPPSFSNSKNMQGSWDVQRDHAGFLRLVRMRLAPGGTIIFSNNLRQFKLDPDLQDSLGLRITDISAESIPFDFKRNQKIHHCWVMQDDA